MAKLVQLSPAIARVFTTVEMIGVVALLAVVLKPLGETAYWWLIVLGTTTALFYLVEPTLDFIQNKILGSDLTKWRLRLAILPGVVASIGGALITPYVSTLAVLIGQTISTCQN